MSDDLLSKLATTGARKGKAQPEMDNPMLSSASARVRTSYPKSRQAGQYVRVTATLLPETVEELAAVQQQLSAEAERLLGIQSGVKLTDVIRMMVAAGLEAWKAGVLEAELESQVSEPSAGIKRWRVNK